MRGYAFLNYFTKAISFIFETDLKNIINIGDDKPISREDFIRSPRADLQIIYEGELLRLEIQTGFQGINDIKQHKVIEAKKEFLNSGIKTLVLHFDIFNGQVAFIPIHDIDENSIFWVSRQQMEGQTVFQIDQNNFLWALLDYPPKYSDFKFL